MNVFVSGCMSGGTNREGQCAAQQYEMKNYSIFIPKISLLSRLALSSSQLHTHTQSHSRSQAFLLLNERQQGNACFTTCFCPLSWLWPLVYELYPLSIH